MAATLLTANSMSDAELVTASRNGNREAFGQIVRKYQSMVSGLIYAACGDLHRSEDIAQETFISAWKSLSGLRDAARLPGWLCQIARHRIADHFREPATQKMRLQETLAETIPAQPAEEPMSADESEMLWQTLARVPQPYRETMVLYYRQGQSTSDVAAAMETTDAGVRQRLARGRQMLREELAVMVERNLAKSAPGPDFSLGVMAALPMAAAAQTAAFTATTAKGTAAAKSGGLLFFITNWLAPFLGLGVLGLVTFESVRQAKTRARKKAIVGYWIVFWLVIVAWVFACIKLSLFGHNRNWDYSTYIYVFSVAGCIFGMALFGMLGWSSQRQTRHPENKQTYSFLRAFWPRFLFITPMIYSGVAWLISLAAEAHDHLAAEIIAISTLIGCAICAWRSSGEAIAHNPLKMAFESWFLMVAVILITLDCRLRSWMASIHHLDLAAVQYRVPLWSINVAGGVLLAWMIAVRMQQPKVTAN